MNVELLVVVFSLFQPFTCLLIPFDRLGKFEVRYTCVGKKQAAQHCALETISGTEQFVFGGGQLGLSTIQIEDSAQFTIRSGSLQSNNVVITS